MQESLRQLQQLRVCVQLSSAPRTHCCTLLWSSSPRPMLALIVDETFKIQTSSLARHEVRVGSRTKSLLPYSPGILWCVWAASAYHWGSSRSNQQTGWEMHHSSGSSAFKELLWDCFWHWYPMSLAEHQVIRQLLWLRYNSGFLQGSSSHTWTGSPCLPTGQQCCSSPAY